jgi:hypothetical protein
MRICSIIGLIFQAVSTSETSASYNKATRRYIPEGCHTRIHILNTLNEHLKVSVYFLKEKQCYTVRKKKEDKWIVYIIRSAGMEFRKRVPVWYTVKYSPFRAMHTLTVFK